jgi:glycosyltransferase involved in cell wall biosynthesis
VTAVQPDISAILVAHREGILAGLSFRSFLDCVADAESAGLNIEKIIILDSPDDATRRVLEDKAVHGAAMLETDFGDQGLVRNHGVHHAHGKTVAFLDADDLWGLDWLRQGWSVFSNYGVKTIVHPEFNLFFQGNRNVLIKIDQTDPLFDVEFLRFGNFWDALCLASRAACVEFPYRERDIQAGFAYEDWHWNCETVAAGFVHRVALGTVHFKRRRQWSQTIEASARGSLMRQTALLSYEWYQKEGIFLNAKGT